MPEGLLSILLIILVVSVIAESLVVSNESFLAHRSKRIMKTNWASL